MTKIEVEVEDLKMLRETLCVAQGTVWRAGDGRSGEHAARIQKLIDQIDVLRPLGPDGSHGDLHTPECGCEHKGLPRCEAICPDSVVAKKFGYIVGSRCEGVKDHSLLRNGVGHMFPKGPSHGA